MDSPRDKKAAGAAQQTNVVSLGRGEAAETPQTERTPDVRNTPEQARTSTQEAAPPATTAPPKKRGKGRLVLGVLLLAGLAAGAWYGHEWWINGRFMVETDDAYIQADIASLGTKVAGFVAETPVMNGDHVKAGQVIARLDATDFQLALEAAQAKRATQSATIDRIGQQVVLQQAQIQAAQAGIDSASAEVVRAKAAFDRARALSQQNFGSKATLDQATADRDRANAALVTARSNLAAAQASLGVIQAQKREAEQVARELDTAIAKARSDVDATQIRAPVDGVVGNRAIEPGQYVAPGSRLLALVPMKSVYVGANFKETQLASIRPGEKAIISVDSLDGQEVEGVVASISPASGSTFSLLPPDNATGNFTKITQRVTVRIDVPDDVAEKGILRPGLSVVVTIDTRTGPSPAR